MYLDRLGLIDFRAIAHSDVRFEHPASEDAAQLDLPNLTVLLGINGGGKSSVLKAIASAVTLGLDGPPPGFEQWPRIGSDRDLVVRADFVDSTPAVAGTLPIRWSNQYSLGRGDGELAVIDHNLPAEAQLMAAYGPGRSDTTPEPTERPVVSHLLDKRPLVSLDQWFDASDRRGEMAKILNSVLPDDVEVLDADHPEGRFVAQRGIPLLVDELSDGIRSFLAWISDFFWYLEHRSDPGVGLDQVGGLLLVDEIDQRLHPRWAQWALTRLAASLPSTQIICTATNPLIPSGLRRPNLLLVEPDLDLPGAGATRVSRLATEEVYGRTADQVLTSSYFGMESTRGDLFRSELRTLAMQARDRGGRRGRDAAMEFMARLADPTRTDTGDDE
jgi:hypothetical protein